MFQTIHEPIDVAGVYTQHKQFLPKKFKWHDRMYQISRITLTGAVRDGSRQKRLYSVMTDHTAETVFRILFDRDLEEWWLEEIWND